MDSELFWAHARARATKRLGGEWDEAAEPEMKGMSSREWAAHLRTRFQLSAAPEEVIDVVVDEVISLYPCVPTRPGAQEAVRRLGRRWPLGIASSAHPRVIATALEALGIRDCVASVVSADDVPQGKPSPDVYRLAARELGVSARACVAVEDSPSGIVAAADAGMTVIAVPTADQPLGPDIVKRAAEVLSSLRDLDVDVVERVSVRPFEL